MRRILAAAIALALAAPLFSCRTARPDGLPVAPLTATTSAEALEQLRERRGAIAGTRSLMRVRATTNGKTQSFRAQLAILDARRMELVAYTPVGTTAMTLKANGDDISLRNHLEGSEWEGTAGDLARSLGFLGSGLLPAEMAMLIVGVPPRDEVQVEVEPGGLRRAAFGDLTVTFEPAAFPAHQVVVTRGADRIELEHLEVVR